jgi:hypothetical protein
MGNPVEEKVETMTVEVSDVSGAKVVEADVPTDFSVAEMIKTMVGEMDLPVNDAAGNPVTYRAHLEREGRQLLPSERCGDILQRGKQDKVTLEPDNIDAGQGGPRRPKLET